MPEGSRGPGEERRSVLSPGPARGNHEPGTPVEPGGGGVAAAVLLGGPWHQTNTEARASGVREVWEASQRWGPSTDLAVGLSLP